MKNIAKKLKIGAPGLILGLAMPLSAQASTLQAVVQSIERLKESVISRLDAAADRYRELLYEENPSLPNTVALNAGIVEIAPVMRDKLNELALPAIKEFLTQENVDRTIRQLAAAPASDSFQAPTSRQPFSVTGKKRSVDLGEGDAYLYAGTLMSPLVYQLDNKAKDDDDEDNKVDGPTAKAAFGYLQYASSLGQPVGGINLSKLSDNQKRLVETTEAGRQYKVTLRSMVAARTMAVDNLLGIYARRLPVPGLGEQIGMPDQEDASAKEVQHYVATRRAGDPEWYNDMSKASQATIARETLFVLVEMQRQLYEMRQDNERILATLSIMELEGLEAQREALKNKEDALKKTLGIK